MILLTGILLTPITFSEFNTHAVTLDVVEISQNAVIEFSSHTSVDPQTEKSEQEKVDQKIPGWIKNNAGWWAEGAIDDTSFVQGIQYLIKEGIMQIPSTAQGSSSGTNEIPSWIKNNAGWWAEGAIDDTSFVQGIQYLIKEGIMTIS